MDYVWQFEIIVQTLTSITEKLICLICFHGPHKITRRAGSGPPGLYFDTCALHDYSIGLRCVKREYVLILGFETCVLLVLLARIIFFQTKSFLMISSFHNTFASGTFGKTWGILMQNIPSKVLACLLWDHVRCLPMRVFFKIGAETESFCICGVGGAGWYEKK